MLRAEYVKDVDGKHFEYYRQFATPQVIAAVRHHFMRLLEHDTYPFKSLDLHAWGMQAYAVPDALFRLVGDFPTLAGKVETLKVAARFIKKEGQSSRPPLQPKETAIVVQERPWQTLKGVEMPVTAIEQDIFRCKFGYMETVAKEAIAKAQAILWAVQLDSYPDSFRVAHNEVHRWLEGLTGAKQAMLVPGLAVTLQHAVCVYFESGLQADGTYSRKGCRFGTLRGEYQSIHF